MKAKKGMLFRSMFKNKTPPTLRDFFKSEGFILLFIFVATFFLRFHFLGSLKNDPAFILPVFDCKEFNFWAFKILNLNNWLWMDLNNHTPLYAYFLAVVYKIFGHSVVTVAILQYLIGSLSAVLVYLMTKRMINRLAALTAAVFMATYWFFIYTQSFIYSENLSMLLTIGLIYILQFSKDSIRKYFISGIIFGLAVISRPDILLFSVFILAWIVAKRLNFKKITQFYVPFILAFLIIVIPVVARNYAISGEILLRKQVGANFYMGNSPEYKGSNIYVEIGKSWHDLISTAKRELNLKRNLTENEADRYFIKKTLKNIRKNPFGWFKFISAKAFSILTGRDFLRTEDVYFFDGYIRPTPLRFISTRLILVLAIPGIILSIFRAPKEFLLLHLFILSKMFILFFAYKTRYLVPSMPFFIIFSSYTVSFLYTNISDKRWYSAAASVGFILLLFFVSFLNPLEITRPDNSEVYYAIGGNFLWYGMPDNSIEYYNRALKLDPKNLSIYNDLGLVYIRIGEYEKALESFKKSLDIEETRRTRYNYERLKKMMSLEQSFPAPANKKLNSQIRWYHSFFQYPLK